MFWVLVQEKGTLQTGILYKNHSPQQLHVRDITAPKLQESFLQCHNGMGSGIFYVAEMHLSAKLPKSPGGHCLIPHELFLPFQGAFHMSKEA